HEERDGTRPPVWPQAPHQEAVRRDKAQTALALGFPGPARTDHDIYAVEVLSNLVSGLGGRFFDELRDRRSLAYTVAAYPLIRRLAGAFVAYIATSPDKEDEARQGLIEQFERLTEENVSREELERAQRYTIGAWKIRSQTNGAQLSDLADALLLGTGIREIREYEDRIRAVTPVQIREVVQRHFDPDRLVEGIVRGSGGGR
ncbi:MAG: M16 family metallopeptidase, partial [Gemmatimonadota bacterium]